MKLLGITKASSGLIIACILAACVNTTSLWKPYDKITVSASESINPDGKGIPSPVQFKIYELSARSTFDNLDFSRAFNEAETMLSDELISAKDYTLQPSATIESTIYLEKPTRYIAILAGFIDIDNARWKHVYPVKSSGFYNHEIIINGKEITAKPRNQKANFNLPDSTTVADTVEEGAQTINKANDAHQTVKQVF